MKPPAFALHDEPRKFEVDEMFFSTTDRRGVIQLGNAIFVRVSGYPEAQLLGSPHNLIRHPDMPRAAFRLVWRRLLAGRPVVAYVKNLAADGRYYWVVALITAIAGGFLSIRFKPTSPLFETVQKLYADMRAAESALANQPDGGRHGMDAADEVLAATLKAHHWADYDAFMRVLLHEELRVREGVLRREDRRIIPGWPDGFVATGSAAKLAGCLRAVYDGGNKAYAHITTLYRRLDEFAALNERLEEKSRFVLGLTREFRFISINAALESTRLGEAGRSLDVIARYLGEMSAQISRTVEGLTARIHGVLEKLRMLIFHFSVVRLQMEMTLVFCRESLDALTADAGVVDGSVLASHRRMIEQLQRAFHETNQLAVVELRSMEGELQRLDQLSQDLHRTVTALQVAHVAGLIEVNHLHNEQAFAGMFGDVRVQIDTTRDELVELDSIIEQLSALAREAPVVAAVVTAAAEQMDRDVAGLSAQTLEATPLRPEGRVGSAVGAGG